MALKLRSWHWSSVARLVYWVWLWSTKSHITCPWGWDPDTGVQWPALYIEFDCDQPNHTSRGLEVEILTLEFSGPPCILSLIVISQITHHVALKLRSWHWSSVARLVYWVWLWSAKSHITCPWGWDPDTGVQWPALYIEFGCDQPNHTSRGLEVEILTLEFCGPPCILSLVVISQITHHVALKLRSWHWSSVARLVYWVWSHVYVLLKHYTLYFHFVQIGNAVCISVFLWYACHWQ